MKKISHILALVCVLAGSISVEANAQKTRNEKQIAKYVVSQEKLLERLMKYIKVFKFRK